jgi:hypothetical protein
VSSTVKVLELKKASVAECDEQERREKEEKNGDGTRLKMILNSCSVTLAFSDGRITFFPCFCQQG